MSKNRRLLTVAGIVLTVALGVRIGQAQQGDIPSPVAEPLPDETGIETRAPSVGAEPREQEEGDALPPAIAEPDAADGVPADPLSPTPAASPLSMPAPPELGEEAEPGDVPLPAEPAPIAGAETDAPRDEEVMPAQSPGDAGNPGLPGAQPPPAGQKPPGARPGEGYAPALPLDRLGAGPQAVGLTIHVQSPATMNLHRPAVVSLVVKNTGTTDAIGVMVSDPLPEGLKFLGSQPEPIPLAAPSAGAEAGGQLVRWDLGTLQAGSERVIRVNVEPIRTGNYDHGATVFLLSGAKAKTIIMEPKLKVEQTVRRAKVLKGEQVQFDITVTNIGDGPARDVLIRAELSRGLRHDPAGNILELPLSDAKVGVTELKPNQTVTLPPLIADTVGGEEQASCSVVVSSPDVAENATSVKYVTVTEPKLKLTLTGSPKRPTDTIAEYHLTLTNPGTAPAQNVRIVATLQGEGRPTSIPDGAQWNANLRQLSWSMPQLEAGGKPIEYTFQVLLGGVQIFHVNAEARGTGGLRDLSSCQTHVEGYAKMDLDVSEKLGVLDVGQETVFRIKILNEGSKEATNLQVDAQLSENIEAIQTAGTDKEAVLDPTSGVVKFPLIERLVPGGELTLWIKAKAKGPGFATCRVFLNHQDLGSEKIDHLAGVRVMAAPGTK